MPISLPSEIPNPSKLTFEMVNNTQIASSTFTNTVQAVEQLGSHWEFSATWGILKQEQIAPFRAFLSRLRGGAEQFFFSDVSAPEPKGSISGTPTISTVQTIEQITIANAPASQTILKAGDYIEIPTDGESELKLVTEDVVSAPDGSATVNFLPQLRGEATIGGTLVYSEPKGVFIADARRQAWSISAPLNGEGFVLSGVEWLV